MLVHAWHISHASGRPHDVILRRSFTRPGNEAIPLLLCTSVSSFPGFHTPERERCAGVESLVFLSRESVLGRETLIVCGRTQRLRTGKRAKVTGNLLHISGYWGVNIIPSVKHIVG